MSTSRLALAAQEQLVPGETWREKFACLEALGYEGLEVWGSSIIEGDGELAAAAAESPVRVAAIADDLPGSLLDASRSERMRALDDLRRLLESSERLGAVGVIVVPIFGPARLPDLDPVRSAEELERELLHALLGELADWLSGMRAQILLEPVNRYETHLVTRLVDAVAIAEAIDSPNVRILCDLFHANIEEADIIQALHDAFPLLGYVHLADSNRSWPGTGHIDFAATHAALSGLGYQGFASVEIFESDSDLPQRLRRVRELWP